MPEESLDELNGKVTEAILKTRTESDVYLEVSYLEERIAQLIGPGTVQGDIARRGAVRAAVKAGMQERAVELAEAYLKETGASERVVEFMKKFLEEAECTAQKSKE